MRSAMPRSIVGEDTACLQCDRSLPAVGSDAARFSTQPRECGAGGGSQHFSAYRPYLRPVPLCRLGASGSPASFTPLSASSSSTLRRVS